MNMERRVYMLLVPRRGQPLRINVATSDYKAIDAWYRDPASTDVPVHIPNAKDPADVRTFLPREIAEVAYIGPVPGNTADAADGW